MEAMAFELAPDPGDRGEPDVKLGRVGGSAVGEDRRLVRDGAQVLARGALACPECDLPISPAPRVPPRSELRCGYCDHTAEARSFFRRGVADAAGNDVHLVARTNN
jgi:hypothetical protein